MCEFCCYDIHDEGFVLGKKLKVVRPYASIFNDDFCLEIMLRADVNKDNKIEPSLDVSISDDGNDYFSASVDIGYCPFCGRNLTKHL